jgi:molybdate transport system regulatory protein
MKPSFALSHIDQSTQFRLELKHAIAIGPGKANVLEWIEQTGSIAEAGRRLGMSYQKVWSLVRAMNQHFIEPLVETQRGGTAGGGTTLTPTGKQVLKVYRAIEHDAQKAIAKRLPELVNLIRADAE